MGIWEQRETESLGKDYFKVLKKKKTLPGVGVLLAGAALRTKSPCPPFEKEGKTSQNLAIPVLCEEKIKII